MKVMIEYDNTFLGGKEHPMIDITIWYYTYILYINNRERKSYSIGSNMQFMYLHLFTVKFE